MSKNSQKKLENTILYLSSKSKFNCYKKLAKLLYFVDFTYYEYASKPITGLKYQKYTHGPIPFDFYKILSNMEKEGLIEIKEKAFSLGKIKNVVSKKKPDLKVFSKEELEILRSITEKYKNSMAGELEKDAKDEAPYIMVESKEEIPYHLAFYRNTFGEMDLENENSHS